MKRLLVSLACITWAQSACANDLLAELNEWVFEPCMDVAAALDVGGLDEESIELGIKREHVSQLMLASRQSAIEEFAGKMDPDVSWNDRKAVYPTLLELCLSEHMK